MMKRTAHVLTLITILTSSALFSEDLDLTQQLGKMSLSSTQAHEVARSTITRPLSTKERRQLQHKRSRLAKKTQELKDGARFFSWNQPATLYSTLSAHTIHDVSTKGTTLEIENGAVFAIRDCSAATAAKWRKSSAIQIKPNHTWFSSYEYTIHNPETNSYVEAKLSLGPFSQSPLNRRISQINLATGTVLLDNNTMWQIADRAALQKWQVNDPIILGDNDAWFTWGYNFIMLNVATDSYLTAALSY